MHLSLNTNTPIIYDFTRVITYKYNDISYEEKCSALNLAVSEKFKESINYLWGGLDISVPGVALFFSKEADGLCYIYSKFDLLIHSFSSIDDFIITAFEGNLDDLKISLLQFYDNRKNPREYYAKLMTSNEDVYSLINSLCLAYKIKWELIGLFNNPQAILDPLIQFCHRVKRKLKNIYKQNSEFINDFKNSLQKKIKNNTESFVELELSNLFPSYLLENQKEVIVTFSYLNEFLSQTYPCEKFTRVYIFGINYMSLLREFKISNTVGAREDFFKALADENRIKIIRLLSKKSMYVGEIADTLNMVLSTSSYHLDILLCAKIILSNPVGKKIYYKLNKEFIRNYLSKSAIDIDSNRF